LNIDKNANSFHEYYSLLSRGTALF
jgi:hypothetical protein